MKLKNWCQIIWIKFQSIWGSGWYQQFCTVLCSKPYELNWTELKQFALLTICWRIFCLSKFWLMLYATQILPLNLKNWIFTIKLNIYFFHRFGPKPCLLFAYHLAVSAVSRTLCIKTMFYQFHRVLESSKLCPNMSFSGLK